MRKIQLKSLTFRLYKIGSTFVVYRLYRYEIPEAFRVSGRVNHKGIIMGKKSMYVILSRQESGQERSKG